MHQNKIKWNPKIKHGLIHGVMQILFYLDPFSRSVYLGRPSLCTIQMIQGVVIEIRIIGYAWPCYFVSRYAEFSCHQVTVVTTPGWSRPTAMDTACHCVTNIFHIAVRLITWHILKSTISSRDEMKFDMSKKQTYISLNFALHCSCRENRLFSLFRHFLGINFQLLKLLCLTKDHWRGFSTRHAHMVHIVN